MAMMLWKEWGKSEEAPVNMVLGLGDAGRSCMPVQFQLLAKRLGGMTRVGRRLSSSKEVSLISPAME